MNDITDPATDPASPFDETVARRIARRLDLREKHRQGLAKLMEERGDLRGVHALADFVDESLRWTA